MIITPYKRRPIPPTVALLTDQGVIVDEHGNTHKPDLLPAGTRAWCSYDTVRALLKECRGEALCWNSEEIRWRNRRFEDGWKNRPTDVAVLKVPFPEDPERALQALRRWRDWLASYGASPTGTTGSAALSLLRATLSETLFCTMGDAPPILQTMGGRVELGPAGAGRFTERVEQWDMPAAYATTIGELRYGGRWWRSSDLPVDHEPEWWARDGRPVFTEAKVKIGDQLAPLIRRPRRRTTQMTLFLESLVRERFPSQTTLSGLWTWPELEAAELGGARILEVGESYVHLGGRHVFGPWWLAIQEGRRMRGLAGLLAKMTGNALWGRFCMDVTVQGSRTIRRKEAGKRGLQQRPVARNRKGPKPAHDLAETVSGQVRARLYLAMLELGPDLLSAHTDGLWCRRRGVPPAGDWRRKMEASQLDLIDPQTLRYHYRGGVETVMAGRAASEAAEAFDRQWRKARLAA